MLFGFSQKKIIELIRTQKLREELQNRVDTEILRWGGFYFDRQREQILLEVVPFPKNFDFYLSQLKKLSKISQKVSEQKGAALIIPTGLACSIGGFAGDASPFAKLLSSEVDFLIGNPNVFNGGAWIELPENALYLEGFALDLFLRDLIALRKKTQGNRIGLIVDKNIPRTLLKKELEVVKAAKTIWGIEFVGYQITKVGLEQEIYQESYSSKDFSSGKVNNPEVLLEAAESLIKQEAEAIAILTLAPAEESLKSNSEERYLSGQGADPIGGLEAICSHLVSACFLLPCAHAPTFFDSSLLPELKIDARVSPELTSFSFLPSVLKGLSRAPKIIQAKELSIGDLGARNLFSLIAPKDCLLGESFLASQNYEDLILYTIESNLTQIGLGAKELELRAKKAQDFFAVIGLLRARNLGLSFC